MKSRQLTLQQNMKAAIARNVACSTSTNTMIVNHLPSEKKDKKMGVSILSATKKKKAIKS